MELIKNYYEHFCALTGNFFNDKNNICQLQKIINILEQTRENNSIIYIIGNGGSSAIAEHAAIDFTKNAGLKSLAVSGTPMLTTFSNDYGYENVYKKPLEIFGRTNDILIAISSSGTSRNILNACSVAREKGFKIITLSGFEENNPLRKMGDINLWVNSKAFGFLEILHGLILHYINDSIIGSEVYMIR